MAEFLRDETCVPSHLWYLIVIYMYIIRFEHNENIHFYMLLYLNLHRHDGNVNDIKVLSVDSPLFFLTIAHHTAIEE